MLEREVLVVNRLGLHARAAAKLVQLLGAYRSTASLILGNRAVTAKSIMGVMLLAAAQGTRLKLQVDGPDEAEAMDAALALFGRCFDEGG